MINLTVLEITLFNKVLKVLIADNLFLRFYAPIILADYLDDYTNIVSLKYYYDSTAFCYYSFVMLGNYQNLFNSEDSDPIEFILVPIAVVISGVPMIE